MTLKEEIALKINEAMKAGETAKLSTLRMLMAAFSNMEIEKRGAGAGEVGDKEYQAVVKKEVKKRNESIAAFKLAGRSELQAQEEAEIAILSEYLPAEMSEADVKAIVDAVVSEIGPGNLGQLIGEVKKRAGDSADGGLIAKLVKERVT